MKTKKLKIRNQQVAGWALQVAVEQMGYQNIGDVPESRLEEVCALAFTLED